MDRGLKIALTVCLLFIVGIVWLAHWDSATCAEWGPMHDEIVYEYDINLKMPMPRVYSTQSCVRRKP